MRVLLLQLDGKLPNIALMRIAAARRGHEVVFRRIARPEQAQRQLDEPEFDEVFASAIFTRTQPLAEAVCKEYPQAIIGGTGVDRTSWGNRTVEDLGIDSIEQDYSIYPHFRQSIGFSQRGCRLQCSFCVVPKKEGKVRPEQHIADIWRGDPWPREVILLDNDFFGSPVWRDRIAELRDGHFKVSFNQGINVRMIGHAEAEAIGSVDYRATNMKERRIYTAWDNAGDEERLFNGLYLLTHVGNVLPSQIMIYMLIGYWSGEDHFDREERRQRLRDFGAVPYPMPYKRTRELVGYQRWVCGSYDKTISWFDWKAAGYRPEGLGDRTQMRLT